MKQPTTSTPRRLAFRSFFKTIRAAGFLAFAALVERLIAAVQCGYMTREQAVTIGRVALVGFLIAVCNGIQTHYAATDANRVQRRAARRKPADD